MDGKTLILLLALGNLTLCLGLLFFGQTVGKTTQDRHSIRAAGMQALAWLLLFCSMQNSVSGLPMASVLILFIGNGLLVLGVLQDAALCWQWRSRLWQGNGVRGPLLLALLLLLAALADLARGSALFLPSPVALAYLAGALAFMGGQPKPLPLQRWIGWASLPLASLVLLVWHMPGLPGLPELITPASRPGLTLLGLYLLMLLYRSGLMLMAREQQAAQLQRLELVDLLTDVPNQRGFFNALAPWLALARRPGHSTSLIMLDLDHFKRINDNYGHSVGDKVLQAVASIGKNQLRDSDLIGRLGGEEFAVLLPRTELAEALLVAERMRAAIAGLQIKAEKAVLGITASMGVTTIRPDDTMVSLIKRADDALAEAKQAGRNRIMQAQAVTELANLAGLAE
jgi:diguanylate cyclase (GGDEF)-like protein